jgi:hypothetical protein
MRTSRANFFKRLGGTEAMYATLAIMTASRDLVLETDRGQGGVRGNRTEWLRESLRWAQDQKWLGTESDFEHTASKAVTNQKQMREAMIIREGTGGHKILDVGEGWGSIGIAVASMPEGCSTIGMDRARFLDQGEKYGTITSRLNLDMSTMGTTNILRKAAKLASRALETFLMIWLSPECRILSSANGMNVSTGSANGRMMQDERNMAAMT